MKVLVFAPYGRWTPHLETDLEIAENHLAAGDELTLLVCEGELEICETNPQHKRDRCIECIGRRRQGIRRLSRRPRQRRISDYLDDSARERIRGLQTRFDSTEELQAYRLDGFDLGMAAASSLMGRLREPELDWSEHEESLGRYLRASAGVYLALRRYLEEEPTDRAYVFNGRMASLRAAFRACRERDIECFTHERGCDFDHYGLHRNALPHSIASNQRDIRAAWADPSVPREQKIEIADRWFRERAEGAVENNYSFTDRQTRGRLPEGWREDRRNLTLFCSSDFEHASISDEWRNPLFARPSEGVVQIADALAGREKDLHLWIRMHPNLSGAGGPSQRRLLGISGAHVTCLPPDSEVCSYALLRASEKVITTTSTVGIEAAYWGKPAVQAGRCFYTDLGSTYSANRFSELMSWIEDPTLPPLDREGALMYGYHQATFGVRHRHFEAQGISSGRFKGARLRPTPTDRARMWAWSAVRSIAGIASP